jgi:cytoplasmic iron level regulating protein YaaA (DUF328/UPF0246 family)
MKILLNTTKIMDLDTPPPAGVRGTRPRQRAEAEQLMQSLRLLGVGQLQSLMDLSLELADRTCADIARWGDRGRPARPAFCAFTGLVYKHLDARTLPKAAWDQAQREVRIISGLYGVLRPRDLVEAYRLEMGCGVTPPGAAGMVEFWRDRVTAALNADLRKGEPVINLASAEYLAAVDRAALKGPVIWPVFKQRRADGKLKVVAVHAKQARGAMVRYALDAGATEPADLTGFDVGGWEAQGPPPASGEWVFVR